MEVPLKIFATALAILAAAFLGWAGVVFNAWQDTRDMLFSVGAGQQSTQATLKAVASDVSRIAREIERHEERPWHDSAGNELATIRSELKALEEKHRKYNAP